MCKCDDLRPKSKSHKSIGPKPEKSSTPRTSQVLGPMEVADVEYFFHLIQEIASLLRSLGYESESSSLEAINQDIQARIFVASEAQVGAPAIVH